MPGRAVTGALTIYQIKSNLFIKGKDKEELYTGRVPKPYRWQVGLLLPWCRDR